MVRTREHRIRIYLHKVIAARQRVQVLDGSPWVQSKPVYVLAASTREAPDGMTFTLRTRTARPRLESELSKVRGSVMPSR